MYLDDTQHKEYDENKLCSPSQLPQPMNLLSMRRGSSLFDKKFMEFRLQTPSYNLRQPSLLSDNGQQQVEYLHNMNQSNSLIFSEDQNRLSKLVTGFPYINNNGGQSNKNGKNNINYSDDFFSNKSNILKKLQLKVKMKSITKYLPSRMLKNLNNDHLKWIGDVSALQLNKEKKPQNNLISHNVLSNNFPSPTLHEQCNSQNKNVIKLKYNEQNSINSVMSVQKQLNNINEIGLLAFIQNIISSIPIFHPTNKFRQFWYILQLILITIILTILPIQMVFSIKIYDTLSITGTNTIFIMMIADILIQMNTGFYFRGTAILDRNEIIKRYFTDHMFDGIIADSSIIIHTWIFQDTHNWILILYFLKFKSIKGIEKRIFEFIQISPVNMNFVLLFKLILSILYVSHYFACIWVQFAYWEQSTWLCEWNTISKTWMDDVSIANTGHWFSQYIAAYYFSSVTMITVGYGDIKAQNEVEMILCTLNMITACGVFAFSVNQIGFIFDQFGKQEQQIQENMYVINRYMNEHKISSRLQYQIKQYLEYYWTQTQENYEQQEKEIIGQLTEDLRFEMKQEANRLVIKDTNIFSNNFSQSFINRLVPYIKECTLIPDQFVIKQNSEDDDGSIYFIKKGSLKVIFETNKPQNKSNQQTSSSNINVGIGSHFVGGANYNNQQLGFKVLGEGEYFGQIRFFTGYPRNASVKTNDFTKLLSIKREDFLNIIKQFPQDYEVLAQINHVYNLEGILLNCGIKCFSCQSLSHTIQNCPFLQLKYDKFSLMKRNKLHEITQNRESCFVRERHIKFNAFQLLQINQIGKFDFLDSISLDDGFEDYNDEFEDQDQIFQYQSMFDKISHYQNLQADQQSEFQQNNINLINAMQSTHSFSVNNPSTPKQNAQNSPTKKPGSAFANYLPKQAVEPQKVPSLSGFEDFKQASTLAYQQEQQNTAFSEINMKTQDELCNVDRIMKKIEVCFDQKFKNIYSLLLQNANQPQVFNDQMSMNTSQQFNNQEFKDLQDKILKQALQSNQDSKMQNLFKQAIMQVKKQKNPEKPVSKSGFSSYMTNSNQLYQSQSQNIPLELLVENNKENVRAKQKSMYRGSVQKTIANNNQQLAESQQTNMIATNNFAFQQEKDNEFDNGFENFRIYKKFFINNNIDVVLKKYNFQADNCLQLYQQIIIQKMQAKKNKRRELKLQLQKSNQKGINLNLSNQNSCRASQMNSPYLVHEKSWYGEKSILGGRSLMNDLTSIRQSIRGDVKDNTRTYIEGGSTQKIEDNTQQNEQNESQRTIHFPKQIITYQFQNKHIHSISDVLYSARKNKLSTPSQIYEYTHTYKTEREDFDQLFKESKNDQSIIFDSINDI